MKLLRYSELILLPTFEERFRYLQKNARVGEETFGANRYLNQKFYSSDPEWLSIRDYIIVRDGACDLAIKGTELVYGITIHHMNPVTVDDIIHRTDRLLNPENLICTSSDTHKALHYGSDPPIIFGLINRQPNDTCPWRK